MKCESFSLVKDWPNKRDKKFTFYFRQFSMVSSSGRPGNLTV
jgi:hypothetical protein